MTTFSPHTEPLLHTTVLSGDFSCTHTSRLQLQLCQCCTKMDGAELSGLHTSTFNQDVGQIMLVKEEPLEEQSAAVDQQDSEHLQIKEEQEEIWTSLDGEQPHLNEDTDAARFLLTAGSIKSEDYEEKPLFSQFHYQQTEDRDVPTSSSVDQMTVETGGGAETSSNPNLNPHKQTSDSSETDVSGDDEEEGDVNLDSELSDSGPETEDGDNDCNKSHRHMIVHTGQTPFVCELCGQRFSQKQQLNSHMSVHTGQKPFPCEYCGKRFNHEASLNMHMNIHTGQMPFVCEICGQRFRHKPNLKRHVSAHAEQKPLACELCKIIFNRKTTLINHMRVHRERKPFACKICGQILSQKASLITHMSVHTGEKPFACELCGQRFSQKTNLKRHKIVHTGEKPFACELCGQRFSQKTSLNKHKCPLMAGAFCL